MRYYARVQRREIVTTEYHVMIEASNEAEAREKADNGYWEDHQERSSEIGGIEEVKVLHLEPNPQEDDQ